MKGASPGRHLGQLLILRIEEPRWTSSRERFLKKIRPAGLLITGAKLPSAQTTADLLARITRSLDARLLLCVEEEGGTVNPLRGCLPPLPFAGSAARKGPAAAGRLGELIGAGLNLLGFNTSFAPVLDLSSEKSDTILGSRTFGSDAEAVAGCGQAFLAGLARHGVVACAKHFPGLGGVSSDCTYPALIGKPMGDLWRQDLLPYRRLLHNLPLILISNTAYKAYDYDLPQPAAFSERVIQGLLRVKLGYNGLAIADLSSGLASQAFDDPIAAGIRSLKAGCDLLVTREDDVSADALAKSIDEAIESGKIMPDHVQQSVERTTRTAARLRVPSGNITSSALDQLARQFETFRREVDERP